MTFLHFDHLHHPAALEDATRLDPLIAQVFAGWPHHQTDQSDSPPFATIRPDGATKWTITLADTAAPPKRWDDVDVICDLAAEMAWERLRSNPDLLCLHAAAVEFGGRLVVMPNARRAGKSTLTVALGRLGHAVFTDDFLPVRFDPVPGVFEGLANGILPRVRLPLPSTFSAEFRDWVESDTGPSNKRYKYLTGCPIASGGSALPMGAVVVLDRQDEPCTPTLAPIAREDAMSSLIAQNFARTLHAAIILKSADRLTRDLPAYRLTYHSGEEAAEFLSTHPALQGLPVPVYAEQPQGERLAALDTLAQARPPFHPETLYQQAAGVTETQVGEDHFLADSWGGAIHRLNGGSTVIWRLLADPLTLDQVAGLVASVFEDVSREQILADARQLMQSLVQTGLILPVGAVSNAPS